MNIDLKKKNQDFENRMAYKSANYLKDMAEDAVDHFIDESKHSFTNKLLRGLVKVVHNTYVDENNLAPRLSRSTERTPELPATIKKVSENDDSHESDHQSEEQPVENTHKRRV